MTVEELLELAHLREALEAIAARDIRPFSTTQELEQHITELRGMANRALG